MLDLKVDDPSIARSGWILSDIPTLLEVIMNDPHTVRSASMIGSVFQSLPRKMKHDVYEKIRKRGSKPRGEIDFFHGIELGKCRDADSDDGVLQDESHSRLDSWLGADLRGVRILSEQIVRCAMTLA